MVKPVDVFQRPDHRDIGPKARKRWINGNENGLDLDNERQ